MSIIVTGVGGPAGVAVAEHLMRSGESVVGVDADSWAAGFGIVTASATVPYATDPSYPDTILQIAHTYKADVLVSTVAEELPLLHRISGMLADRGVHTWVPTPETVNVCSDKQLFALCLEQAGVPHPYTVTAPDRLPKHGQGPWIVKPASGRGSRGLTVGITDREQVQRAVALLDGAPAVIQEQVYGEEFTADTLTDVDGTTVCVAARWRVATKSGISTKGETFTNELVTEQVKNTLQAVGLTGPACVQGFVTSSGNVIIIEVNPRFSGGLPLTLMSGADTVGEYVRRIRGVPFNLENLTPRPGVRMSRYFNASYSSDGATWVGQAGALK